MDCSVHQTRLVFGGRSEWLSALQSKFMWIAICNNTNYDVATNINKAIQCEVYSFNICTWWTEDLFCITLTQIDIRIGKRLQWPDCDQRQRVCAQVCVICPLKKSAAWLCPFFHLELHRIPCQRPDHEAWGWGGARIITMLVSSSSSSSLFSIITIHALPMAVRIDFRFTLSFLLTRGFCTWGVGGCGFRQGGSTRVWGPNQNKVGKSQH